MKPFSPGRSFVSARTTSGGLTVDLSRYAYSLGIIALITAGGVLIRDLIVPTNLVMPYLLGVVSIAVLWGRGPAIFASVVGVLAFDFFLVPPYLTFVVEDTEYVITFLALFIVGVFISGLTSQIKDQMLAARDRESRVTALYQLSHELAIAYSLQDVLRAVVENVRSTLGRDVRIFLAETGGRDQDRPRFAAYPPVGPAEDRVDEAVAAVYRNGSLSGTAKEAALASTEINLPLITNSGTLGVIRFTGHGLDPSEPEGQLQTLEAFANLAALAIERVYLNRQASQAQLLKAEGELQSTLLNSVSHDFRTPLVTITGTLSSLDAGMHQFDEETRQKLVRQALRESEKLNRLVSNLLNMSRLESGAVQPQLEPVDLQDLVGATLEAMKNRIEREIRTTIPDGLPLVRADFVLAQQALMNLVDNALKYSPEGAPVDIDIDAADRWVYLAVADRGPGIDESELPHIFNKFYRVRDSGKSGGTGLGLAIVKGVIDAHSAKIEVARRPGGGMIFRIGFPQLEFTREQAHAG